MQKFMDTLLRQRALVLLAAALLALYGLWSLQKLPIDAVPDITNRQVQINAQAAALTPAQVEQLLAAPLENALAGTPGLLATRSLSRSGFAQITAIFADDVDIYFARQLVGERLRTVEANLPDGVELELSPVTTGLGEVLMWTLDYQAFDASKNYTAGAVGWQPDGSYRTASGELLTSDIARATYLRTLQDWQVAPMLRSAHGVAGVDTIGGYVKQYQVRPNLAALAAQGLSVQALAEQIQAAHSRAGGGMINRGGEALVLRADAAITSLNALASLPIRLPSNQVLPLADLAVVELGQAQRTGAATHDGHEAVLGTALMTAGGNSRTVAIAAREKLAEVQRSLPADIYAQVVLDRSVLVGATINTVAHNLAFGALLVLVVLFLLLGNTRAAIIAALVIPLSFLFAVIGMNALGISGNLMSLGALDFGILVDGAVIVVEATLLQLGVQRQQLGRALNASERVQVAARASVAMLRPAAFGQLIILLVFLPVLSFEGVEGKTFQPMAATFMLALVGAFVFSFTVVPVLAALLLREPATVADATVTATDAHETRLMAQLRALFTPIITSAINQPRAVLTGALVLLLAAGALFGQLGREFMPRLDEGDLALQALRVPSTSLAQSIAMQSQLERELLALPEVKTVFARTGTAEAAIDPMPPSISDAVVILQPRSQWPQASLSKEQLLEKMERALAAQLGSALEFSQPIELRFNELISGVRTDLAVKVYGEDFAQLLPVAEQIAKRLQSVAGASDVKVEQVTGLPEMVVEVNRPAAASFGVSARDIVALVAASGRGEELGYVFEGDKRVAIALRAGSDTLDLSALAALPLAAANGQMIRLEQVASLRIAEGLNQVSRDNGRRRVVVQANVRERDLGSFVSEAQREVAKLALPAGVTLAWGGQFENLARAESKLALLLPIVFIGILLLLRLALGGIREALLVFCCVPLALTGGVLALWLREMPFSVSAAVGFIAVSGVATLNGLVLLQAIEQLLADGMGAREAALVGAQTRLRAVLTTALVAIVGFLPMALAAGAGAEVQKPLATVVIGGLLSATVLTLAVLPCLAARVMRHRLSS